MSPTQLTLKRLREQGYIAEVVERNLTNYIKKDYLGCIDILAFNPETKDMIGVQDTTGSNTSARVKKAEENELIPLWLKMGFKFEVWSWAKYGARNKRKLWDVRIKAF